MMFMIAGCTPGYRNPSEGEPVAPGEVRLTLDALDPRRADADARAAIVNGDLHLLGVYGYAAEIPGVPDEGTSRNVLMIEDTSDFIRNRAHAQFNDRAYAYAMAYNRAVIAASSSAKN